MTDRGEIGGQRDSMADAGTNTIARLMIGGKGQDRCARLPTPKRARSFSGVA